MAYLADIRRSLSRHLLPPLFFMFRYRVRFIGRTVLAPSVPSIRTGIKIRSIFRCDRAQIADVACVKSSSNFKFPFYAKRPGSCYLREYILSRTLKSLAFVSIFWLHHPWQKERKEKNEKAEKKQKEERFESISRHVTGSAEIDSGRS